MPYIKQSDREVMTFMAPRSAGELNYKITEIIRSYWEATGNYQGINDIVGALEGAKLEFYRRIAAPYEDTKITANGDVY